jgi:DHA2 family multidrug resistance protein-like MFS transporter
MSSPAIEHPDGLPVPRRYWAILTIALGLVLAVMDGAIANIALPTIARDLDASPAFSIWIVNGYQLAITISLLPLASLGEIVGYRRVYLAGLVLFTVASLACTLSNGLLMLTTSRIVQGFGAAGIMSVNTALVRFIYPRARLGRGIGINAMVVAISAAVGPSVAAAISWRSRPGPICSRSICRSGSLRSRSACASCRMRRAPAIPSTGKARR